MLPCPYFLETECKFSEDKCRYSHGEVVLFSSLQEYVEPNFEKMCVGSKVLAKLPDKLWYRATIKRIFTEKCIITLETNTKDIETVLQDVFLIDEECDDSSSSSDSEINETPESIINMSLMNTVALGMGEWEKHTKVCIHL